MSARDDYPVITFGVELPTAGLLQYVRMCGEIDRLRDANDAWMNGVADLVESLGFNREAACGPADLLPGLEWLRTADSESLSYHLAEIAAIRGRSGSA